MKRKSQIDFSKNTIRDALCLLLKKYDIHKITISQIADEAGISRSTFYRHFDTVESVVRYTNNSFIEEGITTLFSQESPTLEDLVRWRLEIAKDRPYLASLEMLPAIKNIIGTKPTEHLRELSAVLDFETPYKLTFNLAGFQAILDQWAEDGFQESVDEMTRITMRLLGS